MYTPITKQMLSEIPLIDLHVHLPGTISPITAWNLGIRNKLITVHEIETKQTANQHQKVEYFWKNGPNSMSVTSPYEHYTDIFKKNENNLIILDNEGHPINLEYNIDIQSFKSFDRIMATVQGHRNPPGGIQTEDDLVYVMRQYMRDSIDQKIEYIELQQNIRIAYQIYPNFTKQESRKKFYLLFKEISDEFSNNGIDIRFLHCFNKTQAAGLKTTAHERAMEAYEWLLEAKKIVPGLFIGIQSAGHEKDQSGWPIHLKSGYEKIHEIGLGCEAHGGEGIGVEHMMDTIKTLRLQRLAHGFQIIEDEEAIEECKRDNVTLIMMPILNLNLGACIHTKKQDDFLVPSSKSKGGEKTYIKYLYQHPFFQLLRSHKMLLTIGSDNPHMGGIQLKKSIEILAGLCSDYKHYSANYIHNQHNHISGQYNDNMSSQYNDIQVSQTDNNDSVHLDYEFKYSTSKSYTPISAEELIKCCINGINAAFCEKNIKLKYINNLRNWAKKYCITFDEKSFL